MTVRIRPADVRDTPWLLTQLRAFSDFFGGLHPIYPGDERARAKLTAWLENPAFFFRIAEAVTDQIPAQPIGVIAGHLGPSPFNEDILQFTELFWWVAEDRRGWRAGKLLLDAFTAYGVAHAHQILFTIEDQSPVNPASLTRYGFRPKEWSFVLDVAHPHHTPAEVAS